MDRRVIRTGRACLPSIAEHVPHDRPVAWHSKHPALHRHVWEEVRFERTEHQPLVSRYVGAHDASLSLSSIARFSSSILSKSILKNSASSLVIEYDAGTRRGLS